MGRRPNPIILQFFERGAKLDDSSNRYHHTCKSCGEKFPKGRIDNLVAHLLRKCTAISNSDRQYAFDKLSYHPNQPGNSENVAIAARTDQESLGRDECQAGHNMSALETLAEVSRQHLDTSGQPVLLSSHQSKRKRHTESGDLASSFEDFVASEPKGSTKPLGPSPEDSQSNHVESSLLHSLEQVNQNFLNESTNTSTGAVQIVIEPQNRSIIANVPSLGDQPVDSEYQDVGQAGVSPQRTSHKPQYDDGEYFYSIDPSLQSAHGVSSISSSNDQQQGSQKINASETLVAQPWNQINKIRSSFLNDFSSLPDATRPRPRKRFSDSRREEVRGIRKQGACIRCRMLKKPCSDGMPCNTCAKLVSSRLWKQPCVRTRLGEDFDFYNAGVHNIIYFHETNRIKASTQLDPQAFRFEASHFPDGKFSPVQFMGAKRIFTDLNVPMLEENPIFTPDADADNLDELERYIKESSHAFIEHEPSHIMRESLKLAESLVVRKADLMLEKALILWTATQILVDPQAEWRIMICPVLGIDTPSEQQFGHDAYAERFQVHPSGQWTKSYAHTLSYLRSCSEKICTITARTLVNELERRLLMRSQTAPSTFETFLTSFILLNCLERVCWLFQKWSVATFSPIDVYIPAERPGGDQDRIVGKQTTDRGAWHVERPPSEFVAKGQSFSDTLIMLLRVRKIPPKTREDESGILRAVGRDEDDIHLTIVSSGQEHRVKQHERDGQVELPVRSTFTSGRRATQPGGSNGSTAEAIAVMWLDHMSVRLDVVQAQQEVAEHGRRWEAQDCRCWELAFCGPLLLPTNE